MYFTIFHIFLTFELLSVLKAFNSPFESFKNFASPLASLHESIIELSIIKLYAAQKSFFPVLVPV